MADEFDPICDSCGAHLPLPDLDGKVTCLSCGRSMVIKQKPAPAPKADPAQAFDLEALAASARAQAAASKPKTSILGCLPAIIILVIIASIAIPIFFVVRDVSDTVKSVTGVGGSSNVIVLGGNSTVVSADEKGLEVVTLVQEYTDEAHRFPARLRFGPGGTEEIWRAEDLGDSASSLDSALVGDTLFVASDDILFALEPDTGETIWQGTLSDKVVTSCGSCFEGVGDRLVVETTDGSVHGYGVESSEPIWSHTFNSGAGGQNVVGDLVLITDEIDQTRQGGVRAIRASDGTEAWKGQPRCPSERVRVETVGAGTKLYPVPDSPDVIAFAGFFDPCILRFDSTNGQVRKAIEIPDASPSFSEGLLVEAGHVAISDSSSGLRVVDLSDGSEVPIDLPADQKVQPLSMREGKLLVTMVSSRGTPSGSLGSFDLATGAQRWIVKLPSRSQPLVSDPGGFSDALFDGSPLTLVSQSAEGIRLLTFAGDRTMSVAAVDDAGKLTTVRQADVPGRNSGTPSIGLEHADSRWVLFELDNRLTLVAATGEGDFASFPS